MPDSLLLFSAQIVAILSASLLATGYLRTKPHAASTRIFAALALFTIFYLLDGMLLSTNAPGLQAALGDWWFVRKVGINCIPGLFMFYCFLIFQDDQRIPRVLMVIFAIQALLEFVVVLPAEPGTPSCAFLQWLGLGLDGLQLLFVGFGTYWIVKGYRSDVVDDRRALRWFVVCAQCLLVFTIAVTENFLLLDGSENNPVAQATIDFVLAVFAFGMLVTSIRFEFPRLGGVLLKTDRTSKQTGHEKRGNVLEVDTFDQVFREEHLYREAGLTISMLAQKLNVPEYRLRAFIHKQLGHRNFNAMLHHYRVRDAGKALADVANQNVPVLTIALSVGYQSITPFNNAFRDIMGMTPSEYRKKNLDARAR